jgi:methylenetetrahydrofolate/methylenetetrahydromethanopterin dehydrogenase (NADP+)
MKKILIQFDSDRVPSVFDAVTAYDAGIDVLLPYGGIEPREVRDLVYGAMFTRGPADLKNTAVFIGGINVAKGEALLRETVAAFFDPLRVSVMLDSNGCNTTATAAVVKIISKVQVQGRKVVVLAGTGPVGQRAAALLAKEGAEVTLTSRTLERAQAACTALNARFGATATPAAVADIAATKAVLKDACAVLCTGVEGVMLIPESVWKDHPTVRVLADVNAVPPLGVEGTQAHWDGKEINGKLLFGALGIGGLKMKVHKRSIARLFERNDLILDAEEIMVSAKELAG